VRDAERQHASMWAGMGTRIRTKPWAERLLHGLGAHPGFAEAVLGDLAEERARRQVQDGTLAARSWYARETLRSAPHLLLHAVKHGGRRGRARVAAVIATLALVPTVAAVALLLRDGPPAQLLVDGQHGGDASDGIVLNTQHSVQLAMRVLDAEGHALPSTGVRYRWAAGMPLKVSPSGVVTCARPGDATVRASAGTIKTTVLLRCRPVKEVRATWGMNFVAGDSGRDLAFTAIAPDGRPVDLLTGEVRVMDSTIATLKGTRIRPLVPGQTQVMVRIGDGEAWIGVSVYEPVRSFEGLRPDQLLVVAPVRLARGDTIRWALPKGLFGLQYGRASAAQPLPSFAVDGPVMCMPDFGPTVDNVSCLVRGPGVSLRIAHPGTTGEIAGSIALLRRRDDVPRAPRLDHP
jgi:hypothetical protein